MKNSCLYPAELENLPIYPHLDTICESLKNSESHFLVLTGNTGCGKSTAIPFALMKHFSGNILMLEPRRIAVLNIAMRVSSLLGENVGQTCGYSMHLDTKHSDRTRFMVLTEAILTRKLQNDPSLVGISVIVIDEFHERSLDIDLALAFLKEVMSLRDDLYVIVMSATIDTKKICEYFGGESVCPHYSVPGKMFPVDILYKKDWSVSKAVLECLNQNDGGSILAFLPGIREINQTKKELEEKIDPSTLDLQILHSSVPIEQQKKVLQKSTDSRRRVILSSAIAETSLTVPNISVVIDSGLARVTEFSPKIGMERLVTKRVSLFNADQRSGRAGRTGSGKCIRLWSENEKLVLSQIPEILRTDLTTLVLECAEWGAGDLQSVDWLDKPSAGAWEAALDTLNMLGCVHDRKITGLGKACLSLGVHPRLGCVALSGIPFGKTDFSTRLAVDYLLTDQTNQRIRELYVENLKKRVQIATKNYDFSTSFPQVQNQFSTAYALLCGYSDRIAVQESPNSCRYEFPSGRFASIFDKKQALPNYIVAPDVDAGESQGKIYSYEPVDSELAIKFMQDRAKSFEQINMGTDNSVTKNQVTAYGKIVLKKVRLPVQDEDYVKAVCGRVKTDGIKILPLNQSTESFLKRVQFYIKNGTDEIQDQAKIRERFENLQQSVDEWFPPFVHSKQNLNGESVYNAFFYYLDGDLINKKVPKEIVLANGKKRKIVYENQSDEIVPVLEIIIQQLFGCFQTPKIMGVPVLLKLLSPARRPLQITRDLENFWKNTWPEICTEMRGRYPKHCWDYKTIVED